MHVTPDSAATILVFATASPLHAQGAAGLGLPCIPPIRALY